MPHVFPDDPGRLPALKAALLLTTAALTFGFNAVPAHAQTTIDAGVTATVPGTYPSPWNIPDSLYVGYSSTGTLNISGGGMVFSSSAGSSGNYIGYNPGSIGTVNVSGAGSSWTDTRGIAIGNGSDSTGTLRVTSGGAVSTSGIYLGGSSDNVIVDGAGSTLTAEIMEFPSGHLTVSGGGKVTVDSTLDLQGASSGGLHSTITVTGVGAGGTPSTLAINGDLLIGFFGNNDLLISNGGVVTDVNSRITTSGYVEGYFYVTTVTVDGAGSQWINTGYLWIGQADNGILTISNNGEVSAAGGVVVDNWGQFTIPSAINIGAAQGNTAVAPGILNTPTVDLNMDGYLVFNHTDTTGNYTFAPRITDCVAGACSALAGNGTINQIAGTTVLTGGSDAFSGMTNITGGTLRVNGILGDAANTVTVSPGGTLEGTGTVGGTITINSGGIFRPGDGATPGSVTAVQGDLTFSPGAQYEVSIQQTTSSMGKVSGTAALDGVNVTMSFIVPPTLNVGDQIVLLDASAGSMTGAPANSTVTANGYTFALSVQNNQLIATVTAVPPPAPPAPPSPETPTEPSPPPMNPPGPKGRNNPCSAPTLDPATLALLTLALAAVAAFGRKRRS